METENKKDNIKVDKRKNGSSSKNLAIARQKILEQRRSQKAEKEFKQAYEFEIDDSSDSSSGSDSSSDEPIIKIKTSTSKNYRHPLNGYSDYF